MARIARHRERNTLYPIGFKNYRFSQDGNNVLVQNPTSRLGFWMDDFVGRPIADTGLNFFHPEIWNVTPVNGGSPDPGGGAPFHYAKDFYPSNLVGPMLGWSTSGWPITSNSVLVTETMARTNPSRPFVNPGELLQNLFTLPKMLRDIGDLLKSGKSAIGAQGVANQALAAKFGWVPLINDISNLLDVFRQIDRRNDELKRLYSMKGLRRRVKLRDLSTFTQTNWAIDSGFPLYMTGTENTRNRVIQWGVMRWKPTSHPSYHLSDTERLQLAKRLVLGISASGAFASSWDLIPWTWLLGWVTNVKSYVLAHGNTVPCAPSGPIMVMSEVTQDRWAHKINLGSGYSGGEGHTQYVWKLRHVATKPSLSAYLPYLTGDRLSTLSLLAVQRLTRR